MSADSRWTTKYPHLVDYFDEFLVNAQLPDDAIQIPHHHQPLNPESEDEVPNQEAVNSIARANRPREPAWRDLGLADMIQGLPDQGSAVMDATARLKQLDIDGRSQGLPPSTLRSMR